jgi:hypothetical protein
MLEFKKMKRVFKNLQLQNEFEKDGFVVVDFHTPEQVEEVKSLYWQFHEKTDKSFFLSVLSDDKKHRKTVDVELKRICHLPLEELFIDYQVVNGCFIVKTPGEDSYLDVHQDMTLVDEYDFSGINIWIPAIDLTNDNGALYLLRGSHRFFPTYRGHTVPSFYEQIKEDIKDYMEPFYLKAGQALIFDQNVIHFSPPNMSNELRIVSNIYITNLNARFRVCYYDKSNPDFKNKVEIFEQDLSFMTSYDNFDGDNRPLIGKSLGLLDYNFPQLTIEQLEKQFGRPRLRDDTPTKKAEQNSIKSNIEELVNSRQVFWKGCTPQNILREIKHRIRN